MASQITANIIKNGEPVDILYGRLSQEDDHAGDSNSIVNQRSYLEKYSAANVDAFIEKASRYTDITELTPELLWLFIERIDIGERPGRYNRNGMQEVRIIYRDIGVVDSTMSAEDAESAEVHFIPSLEMVVQQMAAQTQVS